MDKDKLMKLLQKDDLICGKLLSNFMYLYVGLLDKLLYRIYENVCSDREKFLIMKLNSWLEEEGYNLISDRVARLNAYDEKKLKGFIELYTFLLSKSSDNVEKLIDCLFCIPGHFFNFSEYNSSRLCCMTN